jgi:phosphoenolpyruvate synthase/pyruvate phosphate dikinase
MIADLHGGRLQPQRWGAKASNLALIATAGVPVPPGLCLWPQVVGAEARGVALRAWLSESRASSLIVRSSTAEEDGGDASGAGRSLSVPSVPPDAESVDAAISTVSTAAAAAGLDLQSVVIQEEVMPSVSGVAFYMRQTGDLIVEADEARFAVTSGALLSTRARVDRDRVVTVDRGFLNVTELRALRSTAVSCADLLGFDPDIEWGCVGGAVVVFQARPVTRQVDE